jgi:hypothetical protein
MTLPPDPADPAKWQKHEAEHANIVRLRSCALPHLFVLIRPAQKGVKRSARYRCTRCDGEVSSSAYFWYELGRRHPLGAASE